MLQKLIDSLRIQVLWDVMQCHWVGGFQGHAVTSQNPSVLRHTAVRTSILTVEETKEFQTTLFQCVFYADHFLPCTRNCASQICSTGTDCEPSCLCIFSTRSVEGCVVQTACKEVHWQLVSSPQHCHVGRKFWPLIACLLSYNLPSVHIWHPVTF